MVEKEHIDCWIVFQIHLSQTRKHCFVTSTCEETSVFHPLPEYEQRNEPCLPKINDTYNHINRRSLTLVVPGNFLISDGFYLGFFSKFTNMLNSFLKNYHSFPLCGKPHAFKTSLHKIKQISARTAKN